MESVKGFSVLLQVEASSALPQVGFRVIGIEIDGCQRICFRVLVSAQLQHDVCTIDVQLS